jgi:hypothetical protein
MVLSNAERQRRWRDKRNTLARQALRVRNAPLDHIAGDRIKREHLSAKERRLTVQRLLKDVDAETDAELLRWLWSWRGSRRKPIR